MRGRDSQTEIKNVYSPTHAVEIKRPDDKHAVVTYKAENKVPTSDFRLFYDVGQGHWLGTPVPPHDLAERLAAEALTPVDGAH